MLGASLGLIVEGARYGAERTVVGVLAGAIFIFVSQRIIDSHEALHLGSLEGADATKALLIVGIMTIHSFAEGVGVGVAFGVEENLGILIGLAIAVHNSRRDSRSASSSCRAGRTGHSCRLERVLEPPQPLMAVPAFLFVEEFSEFLPVGLGFAAGAMAWLVAADLVPEALETTKPSVVAGVVAASAAAMVLFMLVLL